ncbi:MAG TPA: phosphoribosyltransferase family protein [Candidatus Saccharimonadales bacterium]|nr:phosphoribosyltransferase family protein [Candidatus Saccharimonadales bacterium]
MNTNRLHLGEVTLTPTDGELQPTVVHDFTNIAEYSRFKFGDGEAGNKYGTMLGDLVLSDTTELLEDGEVYVASSAYRVAPPASESLLAPFVAAAGLAAKSMDADTAFTRFKISKAKLATDNYAGMSFEERSRTLQSDLILPDDADFEGKHVVILDDIRVTGLREAALKQLLENAGVEHTSFYYVLNVPEGRAYPQTEAVINTRSVKTVDDVLEMACQPGFIPNVRLCKFILSQSVQELERFCTSVPREVANTVLHYIEADNLKEVVKAVP